MFVLPAKYLSWIWGGTFPFITNLCIKERHVRHIVATNSNCDYDYAAA